MPRVGRRDHRTIISVRNKADGPSSLRHHPLRANMRWRELKTAIAGAGDMPIGLMLLIPRMSLSYSVIAVAMVARAIARVIGTASSIEGKANLRILIVTDYMPPQTHGIAIRFRQYINFMRRDGHEVHVFCTDSVKQTETSFDHPNLPSITNPYNSRNKMAYNAGVKLAWYLSAKQWDLVHVVCPSNICWAVLPVAAWRRIPIYVSHHVEMEYYIYEYVKMKLFADFGCARPAAPPEPDRRSPASPPPLRV